MIHIKLIFLLFVLFFTSFSQQNIYSVVSPSNTTFPELFNIVKQDAATTSTELQLISEFPAPSDNNLYGMDYYQYYSFSNFRAGSGKLSFYGSDTYLSGDSKWNHQINKLFYNRNFRNLTLEAGFGYNYDKSKTFEYSNDSTTETDYSEFRKSFEIKNIIHNTYFGNFNTSLLLTNKRKLLLGAECYYTSIRGFDFNELEYHQEFPLSSDSGNAISYEHYTKSDYDYYHIIGLGLLTEHIYKKRSPMISCLNLLWEYEHQFLTPKYQETIPSFFHDSSVFTSFGGHNVNNNYFELQFLLTDKIADSTTYRRIQISQIPWLQLSCEWLKFSVSYYDFRHKFTTIHFDPDNQDTSYSNGSSYYNYKHLIFSQKSLLKIIFYRNFYVSLVTYISYNIQVFDDYQNVAGWLQPGIGTKFSFLQTFLFDLNFSVGTYAPFTKQYMYDYYYDRSYSFQLRIATLR